MIIENLNLQTESQQLHASVQEHVTQFKKQFKHGTRTLNLEVCSARGNPSYNNIFSFIRRNEEGGFQETNKFPGKFGQLISM